jgi:putative addiction module component (TIGR02574 family)
MSTDDLLVEALRLSREERARIAAELRSSLEEMDGEVVAVWADELRRRSADVREGRVSAVPWTTARVNTRPMNFGLFQFGNDRCAVHSSRERE